MKKVLFLVNHDVVIYNFRKELVWRLIQEGYEVVISSPYGERIELLKQMGCRYIETNMDRHGKNLPDEMKLLKFYKAIILHENPDIIFSYTIKPNLYGALAAEKSKKPIVINITGLGTALSNPSLMQVFLIFLYKVAFRKVQTVFVQNTENRDFFLKKRIVCDKLKILPGSGVNLDEFQYTEYPTENGLAIKFLYVGRIMKNKGADEFFKVAERIKKIYPGVIFQMAGFIDGDYEDKITDYANKEIVEYLGFQIDMKPYYIECNAVVLPSYYEGMSNALLEAAAMGRPVIASDIPGCRETFDEGISGISLKPRDSESLYQAIVKFIKIPHEQKRQMGIAGRKKMEQEFDRQIVVKAYLDEINSINV